MSDLPRDTGRGHPSTARLDERFDRLRALSPLAPFAPAEAIRRRGRRRARRQAASAGAALLLVLGTAAGGTVGLAGRQPDPAPPPATSGVASAAAPQRVPDGWLLRTPDLGPGDWRGGFEPERFLSEPQWLWVGICPEQDAADYPSLATRLDLRVTGWTDGPGELGERPWVDQVVELYPPGGGPDNLADVRAAVEQCSGAVPPDVRLSVVDTGFAGEESLLVQESVGDVVSLTAVVRVGDAVVTLRRYDPEHGRADREGLLELADRAAARIP